MNWSMSNIPAPVLRAPPLTVLPSPHETAEQQRSCHHLLEPAWATGFQLGFLMHVSSLFCKKSVFIQYLLCWLAYIHLLTEASNPAKLRRIITILRMKKLWVGKWPKDNGQPEVKPRSAWCRTNALASAQGCLVSEAVWSHSTSPLLNWMWVSTFLCSPSQSSLKYLKYHHGHK